MLPKTLFEILNALLPELDLCPSITHLTLALLQDGSAKLAVDHDNLRVAEDNAEVALCDEERFIQGIENMSCIIFLESENSGEVT